MAEGVEVRVNLPDFNRQLKALSDDMERKVVRSATAAAATVFKKKAIAFAPVLRKPKRDRVAGLLQKAIYVARSRDRSPGREHYFVGVRSGKKGAKKGLDAFYWRWVEEGHLARGPGSVVRGGKRSKALQRSRLRTAGARMVAGVHYLAKAFTAGKDEALRMFFERIESRIEKANRDK